MNHRIKSLLRATKRDIVVLFLVAPHNFFTVFSSSFSVRGNINNKRIK